MKKRLALWLKYHYILHLLSVQTSFVSLTVKVPVMPSCLWYWAVNYIDRQHEEGTWTTV